MNKRDILAFTFVAFSTFNRIYGIFVFIHLHRVLYTYKPSFVFVQTLKSNPLGCAFQCAQRLSDLYILRYSKSMDAIDNQLTHEVFQFESTTRRCFCARQKYHSNKETEESTTRRCFCARQKYHSNKETEESTTRRCFCAGQKYHSNKETEEHKKTADLIIEQTANCVSHVGYSFDKTSKLCYRLSNFKDVTNYKKASKSCRAAGARLIVLDTEVKYDYMHNYLEGLGRRAYQRGEPRYRIWVGMQKRKRERFVWSTGASYVREWEPGEPEPMWTIQDCVQILAEGLSDISCTERRRYMCEIHNN